MNHKREEAQRARAATRARVTAAEEDPEREVAPWLRALGFRADEVRRAVAKCETMPDASLEDRVRFALSLFHPRGTYHYPAVKMATPT